MLNGKNIVFLQYEIIKKGGASEKVFKNLKLSFVNIWIKTNFFESLKVHFYLQTLKTWKTDKEKFTRKHRQEHDYDYEHNYKRKHKH